jgi:prepilin-type N-terminal cleavage/methylation domain-containing protein
MKMKKGFTLIELLIVIAIIGILSAALLPTILNAPGKARDSARILNISSIATGIESWNASNGSYPAGDGCISAVFGADASDYFSGGDIPMDPSGARTGASLACAQSGEYYYRYLGDPDVGEYLIATEMELDQTNNSTDNPVSAAVGDLDDDCTADCTFYIQIQ